MTPDFEIITIEQTDPRYPWMFRVLGDKMPSRIYACGNMELLRHTKMVAIIGARKAIDRTFEVADEFESNDYIIVSGLNQGCVMAAWGRIIVIIATGLDMVHGNTLCTQILKRGGLLLSEQPSGTKATPYCRIACARLQEALANPIVVVQAAMKSTAMRTVDFARKCGKTILACCYDTYNDSNDGNKYLLDNGLALNVTPGPPPLSENELRLIHLEEVWQKKHQERRTEKQTEWAKHPLSQKMSYAFIAANNIDWEPVGVCSTDDTSIEEDCENYHYWCRHDMSREDWIDYQDLVHRQKYYQWQHFIRNSGVMDDYDSHEIFLMLKFKIDRLIDYWRQSSHSMNGDYIRSQMGLASRLLQIILKNGNEGKNMEHLPARVNLKNKKRFEVRFRETGFYLGEEQEVRYKKAYCLLFRLLKENILQWWD